MRRLARHQDLHRNFDRFADPADAAASVIADILGNSDRSSAWPGRANGVARIEQLIGAGARIDAALALIALELPQWQLLALAILAAVVEAQRIAASSYRPGSSPRPVNEADDLLCCDNFS
jgi:hypothetical protein